MHAIVDFSNHAIHVTNPPTLLPYDCIAMITLPNFPYFSGWLTLN